MAGRGPAPKDPSTRARTNRQPEQRVIVVNPGVQPALPSQMPVPQYVDGEVVGFGQPWPSATVTWWKMWFTHPTADEFTDSDWSFLLDTALLHGAYWSGDLKLGPELRQRVAKFGATPEDRARLRISFAVAEKSEADVAKKAPAKKTAAARRAEKKADPRNLLTLVQS